MSEKKRVLLISPHPDDIEFFASNLCMQSVKNDYETHELIMCCDEYGVSEDEFKGRRIRRIRKNEMLQSALVYGSCIKEGRQEPIIHLHWADYIDGFVPFNKKSVARMQRFIKKINPHIIIGPDPFVYFDGHTDHMATGKTYYVSLKTMDPERRPPLMLYYQSLIPNFFLQVKGRKTREKAWLKHDTQMSTPVRLFWKLKQLLYFSRLISNRAGFFGEGYRLVSFNPDDNKPKGFAKVLFRHIFARRGWGDQDPRLFIPTPEDLGLETEPNYDIE